MSFLFCYRKEGDWFAVFPLFISASRRACILPSAETGHERGAEKMA